MVVTISATKIVISSDGVNNIETIYRDQISRVTPVYIADSLSIVYKYNAMLQVDIQLTDGSHVKFDIQDVTNQAGWTANQAGLNTAITDLTA